MAEDVYPTRGQIRRIHVLWRLLSARAQLDAHDRPAYEAWLSGAAGRSVRSSKELTRTEAARVIDAMQQHLPGEALHRRRPDRERARQYATAGRRGSCTKLIEPPDAATLELLAALKHRCFELGIFSGEEQFRAWLRGRHSPTRGNAWLNTLGKCNRVIDGLRAQIRRAERALAHREVTHAC